jgi:hypothetical protein
VIVARSPVNVTRRDVSLAARPAELPNDRLPIDRLLGDFAICDWVNMILAIDNWAIALIARRFAPTAGGFSGRGENCE